MFDWPEQDKRYEEWRDKRDGPSRYNCPHCNTQMQQAESFIHIGLMTTWCPNNNCPSNKPKDNMETPAGRERGKMTEAIRDYGDNDEARHVLTDIIGPVEVHSEQGKMYDNGGGTLTIRDLCNIASNSQLEEACERLNVLRWIN